MQTQASVEIECPIEEVFRLTNEHVPEWSLIVVEDETIDEVPGGVGTTFRIVTEERGHRMEFQGVITRYEPPYASAIEMIGDMFSIAAEYTFEDLGGSTRVTQRSEVNGKGFTKLILSCFGWLMRKSNCKALMKELNSLKQFCEHSSSGWSD